MPWRTVHAAGPRGRLQHDHALWSATDKLETCDVRWITDMMYNGRFRPDVNSVVNGMPVIVRFMERYIELVESTTRSGAAEREVMHARKCREYIELLLEYSPRLNVRSGSGRKMSAIELALDLKHSRHQELRGLSSMIREKYADTYTQVRRSAEYEQL